MSKPTPEDCWDAYSRMVNPGGRCLLVVGRHWWWVTFCGRVGIKPLGRDGLNKSFARDMACLNTSDSWLMRRTEEGLKVHTRYITRVDR